MRKTLLVVAALAAVASAAPAATAAPPYRNAGGCGFDTAHQGVVANRDSWITGVLYEASVTTTDAGLPAHAQVTCELRVNGALVATGSWGGWGAHAGGKVVAFDAADDQFVDLCEGIVYDHGAASTYVCFGDAGVGFPPQALTDSVDTALAPAYATACAPLAANAGDHGPLHIDPDGDLTANDPVGLVLDCPPFRSDPWPGN
jgi:hypothetical protein